MTELYVNCGGIRKAGVSLIGLDEKARAVRRRVQMLSRNLPQELAGSQVKEHLKKVCEETKRLEYWIRELYEVTNACAEQYARAENENENNARAFLE